MPKATRADDQHVIVSDAIFEVIYKGARVAPRTPRPWCHAAIANSAEQRLDTPDVSATVSGESRRCVRAEKVLFIGHELARATALHSSFRTRWDVDVANDGTGALRLLRERPYCIAFVDCDAGRSVNDAVALCATLRMTWPELGILCLSALDCLEHKLLAFDVGVDDYLSRSCDPAELLARAGALARRSRGRPSGVYRCEPETRSTLAVTTGVVVDPLNRLLRGPRGEVELTRTELQFLFHLADCGAHGASTEGLASAVLGRRDGSAHNLVHRHVSNLRSKLKSVGACDAIGRCATGYALKSA